MDKQLNASLGSVYISYFFTKNLTLRIIATKSTAWFMKNNTVLIPDRQHTLSDALERWGDWRAAITPRGCEIFLCERRSWWVRATTLRLDSVQRPDRADLVSSEEWKWNVANMYCRGMHYSAKLTCFGALIWHLLQNNDNFYESENSFGQVTMLFPSKAIIVVLFFKPDTLKHLSCLCKQSSRANMSDSLPTSSSFVGQPKLYQHVI